MSAEKFLRFSTVWQNNRLLIVLLVVLGFVLRLIRVGSHSYWFDEGLEINRALTAWPELLFLSEGPDPPLFRLVLAIPVQFTRQEFFLRLPSVLFATFSIYLIYYWISELKYPRLGLLAAGFLAIVPVSIYYAQEVSQYSMVMFLTLLLLVMFERAAQYGRTKDWIFLWMASLLALFTYYGLAWVFPMLMLDLAWRTWRNRDSKRLLGIGAYIAGLLAGLVVLFFSFIRAQYEFMSRGALQPNFANKGLQQILLELLERVFERFVGFQVMTFSPEAPDIIPAFFAILLMLGCIIIWWRMPSIRRVVIIAFGILIIFYVASGLGFYFFGTRYGLPLLPFTLLFLAVPVWQLWRGHWQPAVVLAGVICLFFISFWPQLTIIPNPWLALPREELRPVIENLKQQMRASDLIYVYYGAKPAYRAYDPFPENPTVYGTWLRNRPFEEKITILQGEINDPERIWLVFSHIANEEYDEFVQGLIHKDGFTLQTEFLEENAAAALLVKSP